jgi:hypothetical protein
MIRAARVLTLDRRYEPGETIERAQLGLQARRLRDTGHITADTEEELEVPAPDEITDRRINPDYHELSPAAKEDVLLKQVADSGSRDPNPTPQLGADLLAKATAPDPQPDPSQVDPPQTPEEAELRPAETPAAEVQDAEPTGALSDPTGEGDPERAAVEKADEESPEESSEEHPGRGRRRR